MLVTRLVLQNLHLFASAMCSSKVCWLNGVPMFTNTLGARHPLEKEVKQQHICARAISFPIRL